MNAYEIWKKLDEEDKQWMRSCVSDPVAWLDWAMRNDPIEIDDDDRVWISRVCNRVMITHPEDAPDSLRGTAWVVPWPENYAPVLAISRSRSDVGNLISRCRDALSWQDVALDLHVLEREIGEELTDPEAIFRMAEKIFEES